MAAAAGLVGSLAAITLPGSEQISEIAAVLAVASLAILAGHRWGLIVLAAADVVLLGRVWPLVVYNWPPDLAVQLATYAALLGAIPGFVLLRRIVPNSLELLLGRVPSHRVQTIATTAALGGSAIWMIAPTFHL